VIKPIIFSTFSSVKSVVSKSAVMAGLSYVLFATAVFGAAIPVPNGDFLSPTDVGTVGGGLLGTPVNNQAIGSGPWHGSTAGVLGLLLPPAMNISTSGGFGGNGAATISGIANVGVLSILDNGALFSQTLSNTYQANTTYTLTADVFTGSLLSANALATAGVGIGLANVTGSGIGSLIADTTTTNPVLVSLTLLSGNVYQLSLQFTTGGVAPTGNIGVDLFDLPTGLASASLFQTVKFSNVTLDAATAGAATPEPATFLLAGMVLLGCGVIRRRALLKSVAGE